MSEQTKRTMEICFFILAAIMLIKSPAEIMAFAATSGSTALMWPGMVIFVCACACMVFVSVMRIMNYGKTLPNLIAGAVYFINIIMWIEVI